MSKEAARKLPGQNEPLPVELSADFINQLATDLVNGKVSANCEMTSYFIKKLRALAKEGTELEVHLREGRKQISLMESRMAAIRSQVDAYKNDLVEWHRRSDD